MRATSLCLVLAMACGDKDGDSGAAESEQPPGQVAVNPTSIDFGDLALHEEQTAEIAITNSGAGPLEVYDVLFADDRLRSHYTLEGGKSGTLEPGDSANLVLILKPMDLTELNTRLEVLSTDPTNPTTVIAVSAEVHGEADARVSDSSLDVGSAAVGATVEAELVIANDGTAGLTVTSATVDDTTGVWSLAVDPTGTTVAPQSEDGRAIVAFTPAEAGLSTSRLVLRTNDPDASEIAISLIGTGL